MKGLRGFLDPWHRYDEWRYWNARGDPNASKGWDDKVLKDDVMYIREHLRHCEEVLELGPGVGRTLAAHSPEARITCYDITGNFRTALLERSRELNLNVEHHVARDPHEPLPYPDGSFDAAVASQVLLHQRPDHIERVMAELIRVSAKVVVSTSYGHERVQSRAAHAFHHDYPEICARLACEMNHVRVMDGRLYFVYCRL
jgi:SAM-dependent methyltransferase